MAVFAATALFAAGCTQPTPSSGPRHVTVVAPSADLPYGSAIPEIEPLYTNLAAGQTEPDTPATCSTTATSTSPPGDYPTTCSGAASAGEDFTYLDGMITITPAPVTITASSASIGVGDAVPPITPAYSGLQNGDTEPDVLPSCSTTATSTSPVGSYASSCSGASDANYSFTYVDGVVAVATAVVTVTASSGSTIYGDPVPSVVASYSGFELGESEPATPATCTTVASSSTPVGSYATSCSGAADPNYTFSYVDGTHDITVAAATITASSAAFAYGDPVPPVTPSYTGLVNGDVAAATAPTCSSTATSTSSPGDYPTSCSAAADPNYTFTYVDGTHTVTAAAPVTVTASSATITYGDAIAAITPSYSGFTGGQTEPAGSPATCSAIATPSSPPGDYPTVCSGATDPNFSFVYVGGTLTIQKAQVIVTASDDLMTYGATPPAITPSYVGFVNGDVAPATAPTCSTAASASSPVGTYTSSCSGADDPKYDFTYVDGSVMVNAAAATVTASSPSMTYGASVPTIAPSYSGLVNGDVAPTTAPTCSTTATSSSPVGTYDSSCAGAADPNYTFGYVDGTVTVEPATVTVTASDETMVEGDPPPAITPSYSGFVNGDVAPATAPTCSTTAISTSPPGNYSSSCAGAADSNYTFTYVDGTVTVTAVPPSGFAAYSSEAPHATTVASASNGHAVGSSTLYVASGSGAGFSTYTNLTIDTSNGPQPAFCKTIGSTAMGTCSSVGSGTVSTGGYVTDAAMTTFDAYTIIPGGAAAVEPSSVTVVTDVPAADRGIPTYVQADASRGLLKFVPSTTASGTLSLTFGYCDTGTSTYSPGNSSCHSGTLTYGPTVIQTMGDQVSVSIVTSNIYQKVGVAVDAPATVPSGSTFSAVVAAGPASLPKLQSTGTFLGDATVNQGNNILAVVPVPAGMTYVGATLVGGDTLTSGNAVITYCPTTSSPGCIAQTASHYSNTTAPYVQLSLPSISIPGGGTATMPSAVVTMTASGSPGTHSTTHLSEFSLNTATNLGSAFFHGYPSDPAEPNTNPPTFPATDLAATDIT